MRNVLSRTLDNIQPGQIDGIEELTFHWNLIVGRDLAAVTQLEKISEKTLFVRVHGKEWLGPLASLKAKIIREIKRQTKRKTLTRIVFKEETSVWQDRAGESVGKPSAKKSNTLTQPILNEVEGNFEMIKDQDLKETLARLSRKIGGVSMLLVGCMFVSNCTTLPAPTKPPPQKIDLASSFAVRDVQPKFNASNNKNARDPRAYYHYLMALDAERKYQFEGATHHYRKAVSFDLKSEPLREKLAVHLLREGEFEELAKVCEEGLKWFPDNLTLNMIFADVLTGLGEYDRAHTYYEKVTQIDPGGSRAYLLRGTVYEKQGEYGRALEFFKQALLVEPSNPLSHHYLGRENLRAGNLEEAEKNFKKAVSIKPNFVGAREHLAWVLENLGKKDDAIREYNLLLKLEPGNKRVRDHLQEMRRSSESSSQATDHRGIPQELLNHSDVHIKIAAIYYEQALYLKSLEEFQLLIIRKDMQEPHVLMARIYEILGRLDRAIGEFELLRKMKPESVDILTYTARLYGLNKETEKAIPLIEEAISIAPSNDTLYHSLSLAHMTLNQYDQAIDSMRQAIALNANKDSYYFELGALLEKSGQFEGAIESMQRTIELNPMHSNAHNFLGYMYALEGNYLDKALDHLKKALAIQPRNGYFLDSLGWIYFKKGEPQKALSEIKKAMVYTPPDPVLYDHLGDIHFSLENYSEASGAWRTSLSLTRVKKDELDGEMPDPKDLEKKIEKAGKLLQQPL
jgi:tetratricopeptide (TPR) repeat protein